MVLNAREQDPHGVGSVVQEGDSGAVQFLGQLVDVRLQLSKGCGWTRAPVQYVRLIVLIYAVYWLVLLCYSRTSAGRRHKACEGNQKLEGRKIRCLFPVSLRRYISQEKCFAGGSEVLSVFL